MPSRRRTRCCCEKAWVAPAVSSRNLVRRMAASSGCRKSKMVGRILPIRRVAEHRMRPAARAHELAVRCGDGDDVHRVLDERLQVALALAASGLQHPLVQVAGDDDHAVDTGSSLKRLHIDQEVSLAAPAPGARTPSRVAVALERALINLAAQRARGREDQGGAADDAAAHPARAHGGGIGIGDMRDFGPGSGGPRAAGQPPVRGRNRGRFGLNVNITSR